MRCDTIRVITKYNCVFAFVIIQTKFCALIDISLTAAAAAVAVRKQTLWNWCMFIVYVYVYA